MTDMVSLIEEDAPEEVVAAAKLLYEFHYTRPHVAHADPRAKNPNRTWELAPLYHRRLYLAQAWALHEAGMMATEEGRAHDINEGYNIAASTMPTIEIREKFDSPTICKVTDPSGKILFHGQTLTLRRGH